MLLRILALGTLLALCVAESLKEWTLPLEYSVADSKYESLGSLRIREKADSNYTGEFSPASGIAPALTKALAAAAKDLNAWYRIRSGQLLSSNRPCLFLHANLSHEFAVTVDQEKQKVLSLTLYPGGIYDVGRDYDVCQEIPEVGGRVHAKVVVNGVEELPLPDTAAYLAKIEDEKRSRQHGAQADNRSFIAKYWMYIVPVVIFMVVSNAFGAEQQGGEG
ncbi:Protein Y43F8C.7 [Aphelenchoides avenae]|nr:Protein Y43F8C.7 [Aphelenchus avenae]